MASDTNLVKELKDELRELRADLKQMRIEMAKKDKLIEDMLRSGRKPNHQQVVGSLSPTSIPKQMQVPLQHPKMRTPLSSHAEAGAGTPGSSEKRKTSEQDCEASGWTAVVSKQKPRYPVSLADGDWKVKVCPSSALKTSGGICVVDSKEELATLRQELEGGAVSAWCVSSQPFEAAGCHVLKAVVPYIVNGGRRFGTRWLVRISGSDSDPRAVQAGSSSASVSNDSARVVLSFVSKFRSKQWASDLADPKRAIRAWCDNVLGRDQLLWSERPVRKLVGQTDCIIATCLLPRPAVRSALALSGTRGVFTRPFFTKDSSDASADSQVVWLGHDCTIEQAREKLESQSTHTLGLAFSQKGLGLRCVEASASTVARAFLSPDAAATFGQSKWTVHGVPPWVSRFDLQAALKESLEWEATVIAVQDFPTTKLFTVASNSPPSLETIRIGENVVSIQKAVRKQTKSTPPVRFQRQTTFAEVCRSGCSQQQEGTHGPIGGADKDRRSEDITMSEADPLATPCPSPRRTQDSGDVFSKLSALLDSKLAPLTQKIDDMDHWLAHVDHRTRELEDANKPHIIERASKRQATESAKFEQVSANASPKPPASSRASSSKGTRAPKQE